MDLESPPILKCCYENKTFKVSDTVLILSFHNCFFTFDIDFYLMKCDFRLHKENKSYKILNMCKGYYPLIYKHPSKVKSLPRLKTGQVEFLYWTLPTFWKHCKLVGYHMWRKNFSNFTWNKFSSNSFRTFGCLNEDFDEENPVLSGIQFC